MEFLVKPNVDLKKYGFKQQDQWQWWWFRNSKYRGALNIIFNVDTRTLSFVSASKDSIAIVCEMYKNGDIDIVSSEDFITMKLTQEEVEMIKQRRNQK